MNESYDSLQSDYEATCPELDFVAGMGRKIDAEIILSALGVENGVTNIDGMLCYGTYEQIGTAVYEILKEHKCNVSKDDLIKRLNESYMKNSDSGKILPACKDLREYLVQLKNEGKTLIVVTTDNYQITNMCLEKLGIKELFDAVFADDGKIPTKPNPFCIQEYCERKGILIVNVIMVGDAMTDIHFARNAGMRVVAVGKNNESRQKLSQYADVVIENISHINEAIGELEEKC